MAIDREQLRALLPTHTNVEIARKLGVTRERIRQLRKLELNGPRNSEGRYQDVVGSPEFVADLGTDHDVNIALKYSVHYKWVYRARRKRSIPAFGSTRLEEVVPLLTTLTDEQIMRLFKYRKAAIVNLRKKHDAYYMNQKPECCPTCGHALRTSKKKAAPK